MADRMGDMFAQDRYGQMGLDAGIRDIGRRRYGPNLVPGAMRGQEPLLITPHDSDIRATQGVGSMANPARFHDALTRMPISTNIEYGQPDPQAEWLMQWLGR